jgi:hypothetical protein
MPFRKSGGTPENGHYILCSGRLYTNYEESMRRMKKMLVEWDENGARVKEVSQSESSILMTLWLRAAGTAFFVTFLLTLLSGPGSFSLSVSTSIVSK